MSSELTPQQISVSFVAQYYYILSSNTKNLYKFYKNESEMTHEHSTVVKQLPGNINPNTVVGPDIEKKISTLGYEDCKVRLTFVDSQRSLHGSVFVFVEGVLIRHGEEQKEMNFVQSFLLAEQENGYYVRNDYLRFTSCASSATPSAVPHQVTTTASQPHSTDSTSVGAQSKPQNGNTNVPPQLSFSSNLSTTPNIVTNGSHSPRSETSSTAATAGASSVYGGAEENQLEEESDHEEPKQLEKKPLANAPSQSSSNATNSSPAGVVSSSTREKANETHKNISYAAAVKNENSTTPSVSSATAAVTQEATQQAKRGKKHHKNESKEKSDHKEEHQKNKVEHKNEQKKSEHQKGEHKERKNEHSKNETDHKKPSTASSSTSDQKNVVGSEKKEKTFRGKDHPLNKYAVYVRDLPVGTRDTDLKQVFASYGNVIDIHNKSGKDQSYNKYALIFFETKQSVDTLLEKPTVNIEGHECPITRYQRKPKQSFTPRGTSPNVNTANNNAISPSPATASHQNRQGNERRPQRQKFARAPANTEVAEKK